MEWEESIQTEILGNEWLLSNQLILNPSLPLSTPVALVQLRL
jgi:hypothetical protein